MKTLITALAITAVTSLSAGAADIDDLLWSAEPTYGWTAQDVADVSEFVAAEQVSTAAQTDELDTSHLSEAVFGWTPEETAICYAFVWADTPVGVTFGEAPVVATPVATAPAPGEPDTTDLSDAGFGWTPADTEVYAGFVHYHYAKSMLAESAPQ